MPLRWIREQFENCLRHVGAGVGDHHVLTRIEVEPVDTGSRTHNRFSHGHGFHDFDIRSCGGEEWSDYNRSTIVCGTDVGYEVFHFKTRLRQLDLDPIAVAIQIILAASAGDDVQGRFAGLKLRPYFAQKEVESEQIGKVREGTNEEQTTRLGKAPDGPETLQVDSVRKAKRTIGR